MLSITRILFIYIFLPCNMHKSWNTDSNFMFFIKIILFVFVITLYILFTKLKFCQYLPFSPASDFFLEWLQTGILATGMYSVFDTEKQRASQAWGNALSSSVLQTVVSPLFLSFFSYSVSPFNFFRLFSRPLLNLYWIQDELYCLDSHHLTTAETSLPIWG